MASEMLSGHNDIGLPASGVAVSAVSTIAPRSTPETQPGDAHTDRADTVSASGPLTAVQSTRSCAGS